MARRLISSGGEFEELVGYSRAVVDGEWVFVSGTTGFDYAKRTVSADVVEQAEQTFRNIETALAKAGATLADTVRVVVYLVDAADFPRVAPVFGRRFKGIKPANTTVIVKALVDPRLKIEVELTAKRQKQ
jgi:enamine deaminase RidA (YjgF/YER057c/UK114 family)